jgi:hypothetical protein
MYPETGILISLPISSIAFHGVPLVVGLPENNKTELISSSMSPQPLPSI